MNAQDCVRQPQRDVYLVGTVTNKMMGHNPRCTLIGLAQEGGAEFCRHMGPWFRMDMPTFVNGSVYNDGFSGVYIPASQFPSVLGTHLAEHDRSEAGGQTGFAGAVRLFDAIASGRHDFGIQVGVEKSTDSFDPLTGTATPAVVNNIGLSWHPWLAYPAGAHASSSYWQITRAFDHKNPGFLDEDALAELGEYICANGLKNPKAQRYPEVVTANWIRKSRRFMGRMRLGWSCVYSEGSVVLGMACREVAKEIAAKTGRPLVRIAGIGSACESTIMGSKPWHKTFWTIESDYIAGQRAYVMAGVSPEQIRVVGHHGAFLPQTAITLKLLGIIRPGETIMDYVKRLRSGSDILDYLGGLYFNGHPVGASNGVSITETYEAMIENNLEWGLVHATGGESAVLGGAMIFHLEAA